MFELGELYQLVVHAENQRLGLVVLNEFAERYELALEKSERGWDVVHTDGRRAEYLSFSGALDGLLKRVEQAIVEEAAQSTALAMMGVPQGFPSVTRAAESVTPALTRPVAVYLSGLTPGMATYKQAQVREMQAGRVVLGLPDVSNLPAELLEQGGKQTLDQAMVYRQAYLDYADEILVLNVNGFVDDVMQREIVYALGAGKGVRWLEMGEYWTVAYRADSGATRRIIFHSNTGLPPTLPEEISYPNGEHPPFTLTPEMVVAIYGPIADEGLARSWMIGDTETPYSDPVVTSIPAPQALGNTP